MTQSTVTASTLASQGALASQIGQALAFAKQAREIASENAQNVANMGIASALDDIVDDLAELVDAANAS